MSLKKTLIKGTLILTIAGILTRILGFYNRIFLTDIIGAKELGIYQLIFPLYLLVHAICCQGFESAISKFTSEKLAQNKKKEAYFLLRLAFICSMILSIFCSVILYQNASFFAIHFLHEAETMTSLKILSFAFPFVSIKCCIISYFYAEKKTGIPAASQLMEQIIRVSSIYILVSYFLSIIEKNAALATLGLVIGEGVACIFCILFVLSPAKRITTLMTGSSIKKRPLVRDFFSYGIPVAGTRLSITLLQSVEAILIPIMLTKISGNHDSSLIIYGTLTGMAIPFIAFPSAITNSLAVLLLPTISKAKVCNNTRQIQESITKCLHYGMMLGILCTSIFLFYGYSLGTILFQSKLCGKMLLTLSFLCPFLYINTVFNAILNGLGKTADTFRNNLIGLLIRIFSILVGIPLFYLQGYLGGLLLSQIVVLFLMLFSLKKEATFQFDAIKTIVHPVLLASLSFVLSYICFVLLGKLEWSKFITLGLSICCLTGFYCLFTYILQLSEKD